MTEKVKVEILSDAVAKRLGVKVNETVSVNVKGGVPVDRYWRNRFKDMAIDNAVRLLDTTKKKTPKPEAVTDVPSES